MSPVLHTYHDAVPDLADYYDADALLAVWADAWTRTGWRTVVLTQADARRHPDWPAYSAAVRGLHTVNPPSFEAANYHRWMAMAACGGGFMSDADVLPLGSWAPDVPSGLSIFSIDHLEDDGACPCFVHGTAEDYEAASRYFAGAGAWTADWPHVSDQELLRAGGLPFSLHRDVLTYGDPRLASRGRAVHFKNDAIEESAGTKSERVTRMYAALLAQRA